MSNNNDREKVLATVAAIVIDFTNRKPDAMVLMDGGTDSRKRLYQMKVSNHIKEISKNGSFLVNTPSMRHY